MTFAQRIIVGIIVFLVLLGMAIPLFAFAITGELLLLDIWSFCCLVIIVVIIWQSIHVMKPGKMILRSFAATMYGPVYSPQGRAQGLDGVWNSGFMLAFPPKMIVVYKFPTGFLELPILSNSANVIDGEDMTPVRIYMHMQVQLVQEEEPLEELTHLALSGRGHTDFTHPVPVTYYIGRDSDDQVPDTEERDCPCLVEDLVALLQSPVDEACSFVFPQYTLREARESIHEIEEKLLVRLSEPGTIFQVNNLGRVFRTIDFNLLGVVPDKAVRDALSSAMAAKLNARGTVEKAKGDNQALAIKQRMLETEGGRTALQGDVAMEIARNANTIITPNSMGTAESMIVANRVPPNPAGPATGPTTPPP